MAIDLTELFTRLGRIGYALYLLNSQQAAFDAALTDTLAEYETELRDAAGPLAQGQTALVRGQSAAFGTLRTLARNTVIKTVEADQPAAARFLGDALSEVIRQMIAGGQTVKAATIAATDAVLGTPVGNGTLVLTTKRGDGLVQENATAEVLRLSVAADSYSGGATAGSETLRLVGEDTLGASVNDYDWPAGSGGTLTLTSVSADRDAQSSLNLLTNSDFNTWVAGNLSNWLAGNGSFGTQMTANATAVHTATGNSLQLTANATVLAALYQDFGNTANGTATTLDPLTSYAVNLYARTNTGTGTGNLSVEIVDGSNANAATADAQAVSNAFAINVASLTTTWAAFSGVFRLAAVPPSTARLRLRVSTAIAGVNVLLDDLAMAPVRAILKGEVGMAAFSGNVPWVQGDQHTVTVTNNRGGSTYLASWQALFDRLFDMRSLGLLLPSSGSPTIADTLITTPP